MFFVTFVVTLLFPSSSALAYAETDERPIFLSWPLPAEIGVHRIPQYPNTPWTWNYLGLNPGYQCPPMFGYLDDWLTRFYWRDESIPEAADRLQADPHNFKMVACYATAGQADTNGHEGTDIKAPADTPVYAAAPGKVMTWRLYGNVTYIVLKHCLVGNWDEQNQCVNGQQWYTTYMHISVLPEFREENRDVARGEPIGAIYDQGDNSHIHFEVGLGSRLYDHFVNPWGRDQAPWDGCMWLERRLCPYPDATYQRAAALTTSNALLVSTDDGPWSPLRLHIAHFQMQDSRLAALDTAGKLWVLESGSSRWVLQAENVHFFALNKGRLVILNAEGSLLLKTGSIYDDTWQRVANKVGAFSLDGSQLAILSASGALLWRNAETAAWQQVDRDVRAFQLVGGRLAWIGQDFRLWVREAATQPARLIPLNEPAAAFQWAYGRLLVLNPQGDLTLMDGPRLDQPRRLLGGVRSFHFSAPRLAVTLTDGSSRVYHNLSLVAWQQYRLPDVRNFQLEGTLPAIP